MPRLGLLHFSFNQSSLPPDLTRFRFNLQFSFFSCPTSKLGLLNLNFRFFARSVIFIFFKLIFILFLTSIYLRSCATCVISRPNVVLRSFFQIFIFHFLHVSALWQNKFKLTSTNTPNVDLYSIIKLKSNKTFALANIACPSAIEQSRTS